VPDSYSLPDRPALDEIAHTDLLLDALADRRPIDINDPDDDALAALLEDWRDDLRWPPASALVSPEEAVEALRAGIAERGRGRRGLAMIGSVAATLLVLSGFGAVVVEARPGDALFGLHAMFFDQRRVKDDSIELSAKADLAKVQEMIEQGRWAQAQNQLAEVSSTVESMDDGDSRHDLMNEVNLLNTRVESRNPNATLPPAAPPPTRVPAPKGTAGNSKPPSAPAPSTTPSGKTPSAVTTTPSSPPSASASPSPSPLTTTPSSGRHRHHHSSSPDAPSPTP
jgi:hypothetical protein